MNTNGTRSASLEIWYNNLRPAACAATRTSYAAALSRMGFENIEPCKTAVNAVLLRPLRGIGIDTMFLNEYERYAKCELRNMV